MKKYALVSALVGICVLMASTAIAVPVSSNATLADMIMERANAFECEIEFTYTSTMVIIAATVTRFAPMSTGPPSLSLDVFATEFSAACFVITLTTVAAVPAALITGMNLTATYTSQNPWNIVLRRIYKLLNRTRKRAIATASIAAKGIRITVSSMLSFLEKPFLAAPTATFRV